MYPIWLIPAFISIYLNMAAFSTQFLTFRYLLISSFATCTCFHLHLYISGAHAYLCTTYILKLNVTFNPTFAQIRLWTQLFLVILNLYVVSQCWDVAENQQRITWTQSDMNSKVCVIKFPMNVLLFPCHKHCDSQTKDANHVMHKGWGSVLAVFSMFTVS